ncbi:MAG: sigma-54-dependent Fis family transcriptional regulator [Desulfuromonas sp.]|nr:MAG: sigma-54-dependent Fis family transcriptional regulator [Desulfuromonas sp.]
MTMQLPEQNLPATSPDVVVRGTVQTGWRIERLSPPLARLFDLDPEETRGRAVEGLFPNLVPPVGELIDEAVRRERSLNGIPFRLDISPEPVHLLGNIEPHGLSPDFREHLVGLSFRLQGMEEQATFESFGLVGQSPALREVVRKIERYGPSDAAVVVTGETGTGKELVAEALHAASRRHGGPIVAVNCAAVSQELLESELFGHEKGAFTGAVRMHRGRFERADGGTLFLDEIGDMPLLTQAKLLRALETGRIERVGAEREQSVDVRVVCATNVPLEQAVGQGRFRADLYHRLAVLRIHLPPLRDRVEDIPPLAELFLQRFAKQYGRNVVRLTGEAQKLLQSYLWPGNVRELRNVLERVFVENESEIIGARAFTEWVRERGDFSPGEWDLDSRTQRPQSVMVPPFPGGEQPKLLTTNNHQLLEAELPSPAGHKGIPVNLSMQVIRDAFAATGGNISEAARKLGVHRSTIYRYLRKFGIDRETL